MPRPFPAISAQSYIPGSGAGLYPNFPPMRGPNNFPPISGNSFLPPMGSMEPPIMNYSGGPGMYPPSMLPSAPSLPLPMPYPNQGPMSMMPPQAPYYDPGLRSYSRRRPVRICRRRRRRSRHCRPIIRVVESSSCSSMSSYTTASSCSPRRHGSCSRSRRRTCSQPQQQQQQPIILLPIQCQQPAPAAPVQNQIQQQPQQIVLPPIRVQQSGQIDQQQLSLPQMAFSQTGGQFQQQQQQPFTLPPIQLNGSNFLSNTNQSPMMISSGQPMLQPSASMPQIITIAQPQQMQGGAIQYVQAPQQSSSSSLQYISAQPRSTIAPQRALVNSTNKKQSKRNKPIARSNSTREIPQNDLKYGRRPFDWYDDDKKKNIINENVQVGQRRSALVG